jgi:hypothetical protein
MHCHRVHDIDESTLGMWVGLGGITNSGRGHRDKVTERLPVVLENARLTLKVFSSMSRYLTLGLLVF